MARLNIEDQFWLDVLTVVAKLGDQDKAIGQAVRFLRIAQERHKTGQVFTEEEFQALGFSDVLIGIFAKRSRSGIEAHGSEKHFSWLEQKVEAGRKGGRSKSPAKLKNLKRGKSAQMAKFPEAKPSDPEASSSSSSSSSSLSLLDTSYLDAADAALGLIRSSEITNPIGYFIGAYRRAFQARYPGAQPDIRGKVQGQIRTFLRDCPLDEAIQLIQVFCQMDGQRSWFKIKGHDFGTFVENLNPVRIALAQGFDPAKPAEPNWDKIFGGAA